MPRNGSTQSTDELTQNNLTPSTDEIIQQGINNLDLHKLIAVRDQIPRTPNTNYVYFKKITERFSEACKKLKPPQQPNGHQQSSDHEHSDNKSELIAASQALLLLKHLYTDYLLDTTIQIIEIEIEVDQDGDPSLTDQNLARKLDADTAEKLIEKFGADKLLAYLSRFDKNGYQRLCQRTDLIEQQAIERNEIQKHITDNNLSGLKQCLDKHNRQLALNEVIADGQALLPYFIRVNWQNDNFASNYWDLFKNYYSQIRQLYEQRDPNELNAQGYFQALGLHDTNIRSLVFNLSEQDNTLVQAAMTAISWYEHPTESYKNLARTLGLLNTDLRSLVFNLSEQDNPLVQAMKTLSRYDHTPAIFKVLAKDLLTLANNQNLANKQELYLTIIQYNKPQAISELIPHLNQFDNLKLPQQMPSNSDLPALKTFKQTFKSENLSIPDDFGQALLQYLIITGKINNDEFILCDVFKQLCSNPNETTVDLCFQYSTYLYRNHLRLILMSLQRQPDMAHFLLIRPRIELNTKILEAIPHASREQVLQLILNLPNFPSDFLDQTYFNGPAVFEKLIGSRDDITWRDVIECIASSRSENIQYNLILNPLFDQTLRQPNTEFARDAEPKTLFRYTIEKSIEHNNFTMLYDCLYHLAIFDLPISQQETYPQRQARVLQTISNDTTLMRELYAKAIHKRSPRLSGTIHQAFSDLMEYNHHQQTLVRLIPLADFIWRQHRLYGQNQKPLVDKSELNWAQQVSEFSPKFTVVAQALQHPRLQINEHQSLTYQNNPAFNSLLLQSAINIIDQLKGKGSTIDREQLLQKLAQRTKKLSKSPPEWDLCHRHYLGAYEINVGCHIMTQLVDDCIDFFNNYNRLPDTLEQLDHHLQYPNLDKQQIAAILETTGEKSIDDIIKERVLENINNPTEKSADDIAKYLMYDTKLNGINSDLRQLVQTLLSSFNNDLNSNQQHRMKASEFKRLLKQNVLLEKLFCAFGIKTEQHSINLIDESDTGLLQFNNSNINEMLNLNSSQETIEVLLECNLFAHFFNNSFAAYNYFTSKENEIKPLTQAINRRAGHQDEADSTNALHLAISDYSPEVVDIASCYREGDFQTQRNQGSFLLHALYRDAGKSWQILRQKDHQLPVIPKDFSLSDEQDADSIADQIERQIDQNKDNSRDDKIQALLAYAIDNNKTNVLPYLVQEITPRDDASIELIVTEADNNKAVKDQLLNLLDRHDSRLLQTIFNKSHEPSDKENNDTESARLIRKEFTKLKQLSQERPDCVDGDKSIEMTCIGSNWERRSQADPNQKDSSANANTYPQEI